MVAHRIAEHVEGKDIQTQFGCAIESCFEEGKE
jgi:hypothetical protein